MHNFYSLRHASVALMCTCVVCSACSKINESNFSQIKTGMTKQEVFRILGEPTKFESVDLAGMTGATAIWTDKHTEITIQFFNDKVAIKSFIMRDKENKAVELEAEI